MEIRISEDGSMRLSAQELHELGIELAPGSRLLVGEAAPAPMAAHPPRTLEVRPLDPPLSRVYVEPTGRCNLRCTTCVRNQWIGRDSAFADLPYEDFLRMVEGLSQVDTLRRMSFWGYGEPLLHPHIAEMVACARRELGVRTQIITNGMLLDDEAAEGLLEAGLDSLVVSIDGSEAVGYKRVRRGADMGVVLENLKRFLRMRKRFARDAKRSGPTEVGIEFVATRDSIAQIGDVHALAADLGVDFTFVSNVLPYSKSDASTQLYTGVINNMRFTPRIYLPPMDNACNAASAIADMLAPNEQIPWLSQPAGSLGPRCPFVDNGSLVVSSNGDVSPCMSLMRTASCYVLEREKRVEGVSYGNIRESSLPEIWRSEDFVAFRERVQRFHFAPCVQCSGCSMAKTNGCDCYGSPFPSCGDCLWAQGVIQCP